MGRVQTFETATVVAAARDLFWDRGYEATSVADLEDEQPMLPDTAPTAQAAAPAPEPEPQPEPPAEPKPPRARKGKPPVPAWEDVLLGVRSSGQR